MGELKVLPVELLLAARSMGTHMGTFELAAGCKAAQFVLGRQQLADIFLDERKGLLISQHTAEGSFAGAAGAGDGDSPGAGRD
ncbi:MAG: hypothetical protein ACRC1L_06100 [Prochlorococcaceae cyanobacterium]